MDNTQTIVTLVACTASLVVGYLCGYRETVLDQEIVDAEGWHQHVQSALWVARRQTPELDETVAS